MYPNTKKAIILATIILILSSSQVSFAKTPKFQTKDPEKLCLAKAIYYEARGEPDLAKKAVAKIVLNRKDHKKFPKTICKVVNQTDTHKGKKVCQFSWVCSKQKIDIESDSWEDAKILSESILTHKVSLPRLGSNVLFFKSVRVRRSFGKGYKFVSKIGNSNFYEKNII